MQGGGCSGGGGGCGWHATQGGTTCTHAHDRVMYGHRVMGWAARTNGCTYECHSGNLRVWVRVWVRHGWVGPQWPSLAVGGGGRDASGQGAGSMTTHAALPTRQARAAGPARPPCSLHAPPTRRHDLHPHPACAPHHDAGIVFRGSNRVAWQMEGDGSYWPKRVVYVGKVKPQPEEVRAVCSGAGGGGLEA